MLEGFDRAIRFLTRLGYWVAVAATLLLMLLGGLDVIATQFLGTPIPAALELQEVLLAAMIFMGLAHVQEKRQHISVEIVVSRFSQATRRRLNLLVLVASVFVLGVIAWRSGVLALSSIEMRETAGASLAFPIYPAKVLVALGAALACLECVRQIACWFRGEHEPVAAQAAVGLPH